MCVLFSRGAIFIVIHRTAAGLFLRPVPSRPVSQKAAENEDGGSPRATTARGGAATPSFPAHKELRKVVENLSALRMRQVRLGQGGEAKRCFSVLATFFSRTRLFLFISERLDCIGLDWIG